MHERQPSLFCGGHNRSEIIVLCVRWYLRYPLSYRNPCTRPQAAQLETTVAAISRLDAQSFCTQIGYILQELSQVLLERTGTEERYFEPIPATLITGLKKLREELDWVDAGSQNMSPGEADRNYGQWN